MVRSRASFSPPAIPSASSASRTGTASLTRCRAGGAEEALAEAPALVQPLPLHLQARRLRQGPNSPHGVLVGVLGVDGLAGRERDVEFPAPRSAPPGLAGSPGTSGSARRPRRRPPGGRTRSGRSGPPSSRLMRASRFLLKRAVTVRLAGARDDRRRARRPLPGLSRRLWISAWRCSRSSSRRGPGTSFHVMARGLRRLVLAGYAGALATLVVAPIPAEPGVVIGGSCSPSCSHSSSTESRRTRETATVTMSSRSSAPPGSRSASGTCCCCARSRARQLAVFTAFLLVVFADAPPPT